MSVGFNPSVSNNKQQKQSFCAINPKYYQKAQDAVREKGGYHFVVRDIQDAYALDKLSKTDTQDTLDAIKEIYPENFHKVVDNAKEWLKSFPKK